VKTHAAVPDVKNLNRVGEEVAKLVEQHVANAAPEHHTQDAVKHDVLNRRRCLAQIRSASGVGATQHDKQYKGRHVHQAVPFD